MAASETGQCAQKARMETAVTSKTDVITGIVVICLSIFCYWGTTFTTDVTSTTDPVGPVAFARWIAFFLFLCGIAQTILGLRAKNPPRYWPEKGVVKNTLGFAALICGYAALAMWIGDITDAAGLQDIPSGYGFTAASFLYLAAALFVCGRRNIVEIGLVSFLAPASVCYIFTKFFQITLP
jgi:hypothetical protein